MNADQISSQLMDHTRDISALWESAKSAHKRHDNHEQIALSVHELAKNIATVAAKLELIAEKMDKSVARIDTNPQSKWPFMLALFPPYTAPKKPYVPLGTRGFS